jgi:hypothetical protein
VRAPGSASAAMTHRPILFAGSLVRHFPLLRGTAPVGTTRVRGVVFHSARADKKTGLRVIRKDPYQPGPVPSP